MGGTDTGDLTLGDVGSSCRDKFRGHWDDSCLDFGALSDVGFPRVPLGALGTCRLEDERPVGDEVA